MKNDPHVTEVSDDGALLRRYRNEIVDLKRRLEEASVCVSVLPNLTSEQNERNPQLVSHGIYHVCCKLCHKLFGLHFSQVSTVTRTAETEKEVLAQLLQEKDQLQREQEDRIRNLTNIIVTSAKFVAVKKVLDAVRLLVSDGSCRTETHDSP